MPDTFNQDRAGALASPIAGTVYEGRVGRIQPPDDPLRYDDHVEYRDSAGLQEICDQLQTPRPFTLLHPPGLISRGTQADIIGQVIGARIDGDYVIARILVSDPRGVLAINDGIHELSLGYLSALRDGIWQTNIKIDHLALVPLARCGSTCSLRADCAGASATCPCKSRAMDYKSVTVADPNSDSTLNAIQRHELPSSMFADPASHSLPLEDENHVRDAMARFDQTHFKGPAERKAAYHHIIARAHQLGIDPAGFEKKYSANLDQRNLNMDELQKKLDAMTNEAANQKARADKLDGELASVRASLTAAEVVATNAQATLLSAKTAADAALATEKTRADAAEQSIKTTVEKAKLDADLALGEAVRTRVVLETHANRILGATDKDGKPIDRSALDDRAIKVAIIKHVDGLDVDAAKPVAFVDGVFAGSLNRATVTQASVAAVRSTIEPPRTDSGPKAPALFGPEGEAAARKFMADNKRAGKA